MMDKNVKVKNKIHEGKIFYIIVYTVMTLFVLICILPMIHVLALSFSSANHVVGFIPKGFKFYSYGVVFEDRGFFDALKMSLLVSFGGTIISLLVNFLAAYALSKKDLPFRKFFSIFFVIMMLFSGGIIPNFIWFKILNIVDTPMILILPMLVQFYYIMLIKTYLEDLPASVEEAALIDGANKFALLWKIILPMSIPIILTVALYIFVGYWNNYQLALYYLPTAAKYYPLAMFILNFINGSAINDMVGDINKALHKSNIEAALIILSTVPILISYPFTLKYMVKGSFSGAVKE